MPFLDHIHEPVTLVSTYSNCETKEFLNHLVKTRKERTTITGLGCFEVWITQQKSFDSIF